ncbi:hypothetical protein GPECTOR_425g289 [Gonium pectorale]|uniref:Helitron helicase-like domain-containing protein n=1 Tax=Gonium pectorale TaxID=33097 RepID=A0A150FWC4_GONPE|nr:hypothetical protein GPECTOR_425g289 [Gonium pectorale]|eukprot:KXZ41505.1 hypothetical protein GPECTOR_425g289 [Gonium pectorale]
MSFLAWIRLQLQRWYPPLADGAEDESAHAPHFILDMFDAWQRHEVHRSAAVRLKLYPHLIKQLGLMDVGMLLQTSDLLAAGLSRAELAGRLQNAPPAVANLVQAARITAARVVGTPASYASLRSRAYGLWTVFGSPTASFTLNPASVNSEAAFNLMGRPYSFDVKGEPIGRPGASERWHLVAAHPLSCAESFAAFISAFCDVFFGWPDGAQRQQNPNCLFGRVDAFFIKFEMNQRGELHAHGCVWQPGMQLARLEHILSAEGANGAAQRGRLLDFMESIQVQGFASPLLYSTDDRPVHAQKLTPEVRRECEGVPPEAAERLTALQADLLQGALQEVKVARARAAMRPPLRAGSLAEAEALGLFAAEAVLELLLHRHREGTCTQHGTMATDLNCRMRMPRIIHWVSTWLQQRTTCVHLKRHSRWVVAHCVALLLAAPCNHTVAFVCDIGRWLRTAELWDQRHPGLTEDDPKWQQRPRLPSLAQLAADAADYALKYATKAEPMQGGAAVLAAANLLRHRAQLASPVERAAVVGEPPLVLEVLRKLSISSIGKDAAARAAAGAAVGAAAAGAEVPRAGAAGAGAGTSEPMDVETLEAAAAAVEPGVSVGAVTAQQTFSAPAAALLILLGRDAIETRQAQPIDYRTFTEHLRSAWERREEAATEAAFIPKVEEPLVPAAAAQSAAAGAGEGAAACLQQEAGPLEAVEATDAEVAAEEAGLMPWVEGGAAVPSAFPRRAVQATTRLTDYLFRGPRFRYCSPVVMAMLVYKQLHVRLARRMLDNVNQLALVRMRAAERKLLQAEVERTVEEEAEAALIEGGHEEVDEPVPYEDADEEQEAWPTRKWRREGGDVGTVWRDRCLSDEDATALLARFKRSGEGAEGSVEADPYVAAALAAVQLPERAPQQQLANAAQVVRTQQQCSEEDFARLTREMLDYTDSARLGMGRAGGLSRAAQEVLRLFARDTPHVTAKLVLVQADGHEEQQPAPSVWPDSGGSIPPFVRCSNAPSPEETALLFSLTEDQREPFLLYAHLLLTEALGPQHKQPPVCSVLTGKAGTGKSRVLQALLWLAFQHDCEKLIGLGRFQRAKQLDAVEAHLSDVRFIFLDEFSTCSLSHWADICRNVHSARTHVAPSDPFLGNGPLADLHGLFVGDPRQLQQPLSTPLYHGSVRSAGVEVGGAAAAVVVPLPPVDQLLRGLLKQHGVKEELGRGLWCSIPHAFVLSTQHRQVAADASAQALLRTAETCAGIEPVSNVDVDRLCRELNGQAVGAQWPLPAEPFVVVQRHSVRVPLAQRLVRMHAAAKGQQLLLWRSSDLSPDGAALPTSVLHRLEGLGAEKDQEGTPAVGAFFNGVRYYFTDNERVALHHVHNNGATGAVAGGGQGYAGEALWMGVGTKAMLGCDGPVMLFGSCRACSKLLIWWFPVVPC